MLTNKVGNLLEADVDVILHQANLYHTFGSGLAAQIKKIFPEAYDADCATAKGDEKKLGTYSIGKISKPHNRIKRVINLYSQYGIGGQDRNTSYDKMVDGLFKLHAALLDPPVAAKKYKLGIPYQLGCGLANGNWEIVQAILKAEFEDSDLEVEIYTLPELVKK